MGYTGYTGPAGAASAFAYQSSSKKTANSYSLSSALNNR